MFRILSLAALVFAASASTLSFISLPQSIRLPSPSQSQPLSTSDLAQLNSNLLGLSARTPKGFAVETSLFSRPRALAVVQVSGFELPTDGDKYSVEKNGNADVTSVDEELAVTFGADRESVSVNGAGITGSSLAQQATQQKKVDDSVIKTKIPALRAELENIYALVSAVKNAGAKFNKDSADIYRIDIQGLTGLELSAEEKETASSDINNAVEQLAKALNTVYGEQVVLEVLSLSAAIEPAFNATSDEHHIRKRDVVPDNDVDKRLKQYREAFNVSVFTSTDYPAIFAIFAGLIIALVLGVLYTTVGMMTMDPGKDSIIYRMTTTRMKKD